MQDIWIMKNYNIAIFFYIKILRKIIKYWFINQRDIYMFVVVFLREK